MKVLLKIAIANKQYGILKDGTNNANTYINKLTESLKSKGLLVFVENNGRHVRISIN